MTWQEELRKLDEDFSSGNITADEYRVRRDQVLSSAVAPASPQPSSSEAEATQVVAPVEQPQQPASDATQVVPRSEFPATAEPTQAVPPSWQQGPPSGGFAQQGPPSGGFPQQGPPSGGFPQQNPAPGMGAHTVGEWGSSAHGQEQWGTPQHQDWGTGSGEHEQALLWAGQELPPAAPPAEDWVEQGYESGADGEKGKAGRIVGVVLTVLLLAGIAFGAYWLWGRDSDPSASGGGGEPTTTAPVTTTTQEPEPEPEKLPIAELEGEAATYDDITSFDGVDGLNYLVDEETSAYEKADAGETRFQVHTLPNKTKVVLLLTQASSATDAKAAAKKLGRIQITNGAKRGSGAPSGITVTEFTNPKDKSVQIRAHYASGDVIVRIEIRSDKGLKAARADLKTVLNAQLEVLPADG